MHRSEPFVASSGEISLLGLVLLKIFQSGNLACIVDPPTSRSRLNFGVPVCKLEAIETNLGDSHVAVLFWFPSSWSSCCTGRSLKMIEAESDDLATSELAQQDSTSASISVCQGSPH